MKNIALILIIILTITACNSSSKESTKRAAKEAPKSVQNETTNKATPSADYATLLIDYSCNLDIAEVAKVLGVPQDNLSIPEFKVPKKCAFNLKGFGEDSAGNGVRLLWGLSQSSKSQNKKEIQNYLKNQKELPEKVRLGMSIALAETKDCYIAQQPAHGRVIICNENYDTAFILNYGRKGAFKRTQEQHDVLKAKMTDLANYLLKKHRK